MVEQGIESIGDNMRKGIIKESVVVGLTTLGIGSAMMVRSDSSKMVAVCGNIFGWIFGAYGI